jgi:hypothetical protein
MLNYSDVSPWVPRSKTPSGWWHGDTYSWGHDHGWTALCCGKQPATQDRAVEGLELDIEAG